MKKSQQVYLKTDPSAWEFMFFLVFISSDTFERFRVYIFDLELWKFITIKLT